MTTQLQTKTPLATSSLFSTSSSWIDDVEFLYFSPNFAHYEPPSTSPKAYKWQRVPMQYEHEMYLQLTTGDDGIIEKTANQLYLEVNCSRLQQSLILCSCLFHICSFSCHNQGLPSSNLLCSVHNNLLTSYSPSLLINPGTTTPPTVSISRSSRFRTTTKLPQSDRL